MQTYLLDNPSDHDQIIKHRSQWNIAVYPTDTLRGIWSTISQFNIDRIKTIKARSTDKVFMSIIVPDRSRISHHGQDVDIITLKQQFDQYQGVTYIIPLQQHYGTYYQSIGLTANHTIGVRICHHPIQDLISRLGEPIISTSANLSGQPNALTYQTLDDRIKNQVEFHIQWSLLYGKPSTLINTITGEIINRL